MRHDPGAIERITILTKNISGHDCVLTKSYPPSFVSAQPDPWRVELCRRCENRLPGGEDWEKLPWVLGNGAFAHQTFRYRTSSEGDEPDCVKIGWITVLVNGDMKHDALFASESLLKPVCSAVDVVGYRPGAGGVVSL